MLSAASLTYSNCLKKNVHTWTDPMDELGASALRSLYSNNFMEAKRLFIRMYTQLQTNAEDISVDSRWSNPMARWNILRSLMQIEMELSPSNLQIAQYLLSTSSAFLMDNHRHSEEFATILVDSCMVVAGTLMREQKPQEARAYLDLGLAFLNPLLNGLVASTAGTEQPPKAVLERHVDLCNSASNLLETSGENYLLNQNWINGYDHFQQSYVLFTVASSKSRLIETECSIFEKLQLDPISKKLILLYNMATCLVGLSKLPEAMSYCEMIRNLPVDKQETSIIDSFKRLFIPKNLIEHTKDQHTSLVNRYKNMNALLLGHINTRLKNYDRAVDLFDEVLRNTTELDLQSEANLYLKKLKNKNYT